MYPISNSAIRTKSNVSHLKIAFAIIVVALALRVTWAVLVPVVPLSDGRAYDLLARTLAEHGVYGWSADRPSAYWPPERQWSMLRFIQFLGKLILQLLS